MTLRYETDMDASGRRTVVCDECGYTRHTHWRIEQIRHPCPTAPRADPVIPDVEELQKSDPTLVGNRLESLFKDVGVPPCGGCGKRRDWLNVAHLWLRSPAEYAAMREKFRSDTLSLLSVGIFSAADISDRLSLEPAAASHWLRQMQREGLIGEVVVDNDRLYGLVAERHNP